jgi:hypothetical protein
MDPLVLRAVLKYTVNWPARATAFVTKVPDGPVRNTAITMLDVVIPDTDFVIDDLPALTARIPLLLKWALPDTARATPVDEANEPPTPEVAVNEPPTPLVASPRMA